MKEGKLLQRALLRFGSVIAAFALADSTTDELGAATAVAAGVALVMFVEVVLGWILPLD